MTEEEMVADKPAPTEESCSDFGQLTKESRVASNGSALQFLFDSREPSEVIYAFLPTLNGFVLTECFREAY